MNGTMTRHLMTACASAFAVAMATMPAAAYAQSDEQRDFAIPAGPLAPALSRFASETGLSLVYPASLAEGRSTKGASGKVLPQAALAQLLSGTGLTFRFSDARTVVVEPLPEAGEGGERVLGAVRIEGVQGSGAFGVAGQEAGVNGINGSRDITATEGTGSYTTGALTLGSKYPAPIKDIPQSVSVLTAERLEDQNINDLTEAMKQLPGVTVTQGGEGALNPQFYSRGFEVTAFSIDGGAPLQTGQAQNYASNTLTSGRFLYPQIDMSLYDHVEILRGADGLFSGYGNPGGVVNLVRKKPLDHGQVLLQGDVGSWNNYRVVADLSSPLAFDGALRGRAVLTWQSNEHFYDVAKDRKQILYGILEADVTPTTLLSGGISYTRQNSVPWLYGLMRYRDGTDLGLPRSTAFTFPFNRWNFDTTEVFGGAEQKLGSKWLVKFKLTHIRQTADRFGYRVLGAVDPVIGGLFLSEDGRSNNSSRQWSAEGTVSGAFRLFGREQKISGGLNYSAAKRRWRVYYSVRGYDFAQPAPYYGNPPVDVFDFNWMDASYSNMGETNNISVEYPNSKMSSVNSYLNMDFNILAGLHVITGLSYSKFIYDTGYQSYSITGVPGYSPAPTKIRGENFRFPPPVSLRYDFGSDISLYIGYTDIYRSRGDQLDVDLNPLEPIRGANLEGGVKWSPRGGLLNVTASLYKTTQKGLAQRVSNVPQPDPLTTCCYVALKDGQVISEGAEFEVTGELLPRLQIAASYSYNDSRYEGPRYDYLGDKAFVSFVPKHVYKLWATYAFPEGDMGRFSIGGGLRGQSSSYRAGTICTAYGPPPANSTLPSCTASEAYSFTEKGWAVFSARIDWDVNDRFNIGLNLENLFDKTYYETVGDVGSGNWYGAPRSFTLSLRGKF